ncbi:hypothetical protein [Vibrio breoganii]|uniref:hypothetical protein n=1 Tax=Vibrio breoganii TaxID=553239 RepID=UPI000C868356|nr:hypothetical protein [Vibrio breoganii]PML91926.1 hypothetical protein BCT64_16950 [Vibrio breoganii]PMN64227.1 hypothetical protein BCT28_08345 [Vibrio breoganii]PMO55947.1 hypothetical protein BCT07_01210 [Vibrio breoganii]
MKSAAILALLFSGSVLANPDICMEIGKAQAVNDHERVIELAAGLNPADIEQCKAVADDARADANHDLYSLMDD